VVAGSAFSQRVGLAIHLKRFVARLVLNNKVDRPNVSYRVVLVAAPSTTSSDTYTEQFVGGWFSGVHQPANSVVLSDTVFPLNQGSTMTQNVTPDKERSFNHVVDVPIDHAVYYNTDGLCQTRLTCYVISYDAYGTLVTDNIASIAQATWRIDYLDP
jgi:hypothetical protein